MFKLDLEKAENQRSNCQHPLDLRKSKRILEKHLLQLQHQSFQMNIQDRFPLGWTGWMKQQTGSKLGKEYVKAVYCHFAYFTYMQSTS